MNPSMISKTGWRTALTVGLSLCLLAAMAVANLARPEPEDAEPYHQRVREAVEAIPLRIGAWVGQDIEPPQAAINLLQPNILFNRRYRNLETRRKATLLIVHCKNARDLAGHYPPVCYPAHGWVQESATRAKWMIGVREITGTQYSFTFDRTMGQDRIGIRNFMVLPDGAVVADMVSVRRAAADYARHFFGAGQVQLVTDGDLPLAEQEDIFREIVDNSHFRAALDALGLGVREP